MEGREKQVTRGQENGKETNGRVERERERDEDRDRGMHGDALERTGARMHLGW